MLCLVRDEARGEFVVRVVLGFDSHGKREKGGGGAGDRWMGAGTLLLVACDDGGITL